MSTMLIGQAPRAPPATLRAARPAGRTSPCARRARRGRSRAGAGSPCTVSRCTSSRSVAGLGGLPLRDRRAQHDVAEDALLGLLVDQPGAQLVHREGQHVGGALLLHPLLVQLGDGRLVDELDAQLGLRVHAHLVHHEARQPGQLGYVELGTGLVEDLDAHARLPAGGARGRRGGAGPGSVAHAGLVVVVGRDDVRPPAGAGPRRAGQPVEGDVLDAVEDVLARSAARCGCPRAGRPG